MDELLHAKKHIKIRFNFDFMLIVEYFMRQLNTVPWSIANDN